MIRCKDVSLKLVVWLIIYKNNSQSVHLGTISFCMHLFPISGVRALLSFRPLLILLDHLSSYSFADFV